MVCPADHNRSDAFRQIDILGPASARGGSKSRQGEGFVFLKKYQWIRMADRQLNLAVRRDRGISELNIGVFRPAVASANILAGGRPPYPARDSRSYSA
jgi:hypothetical protein